MKLEKNYKRKMQIKMLDMMMDIDKLCKKNNIDYYLMYGSCLGAVRHRGFIPWDDDFDIGMTDDNYFRFLKACENELDSNKYFVQTPDKEKNYYLSFAKIRDITTTLIEENNNNIDITYGIYIDVFPLVGIPKNIIKRKMLKIYRAFMLSSNINVINSKILKLIFNMIIKVFGKKNVLNFCTNKCFKNKCKNCQEWVSICDGEGFEKNIFDKNIFGKPQYVDFENTKLPIPNNYDKYLTQTYNDYMKVPTKSQIKDYEHTPYFLDLDLPYNEYLKNAKKSEGKCNEKN